MMKYKSVSKNNRKVVTILLPAFLQYRKPFFEQLYEKCIANNIDLRIIAGEPSPKLRMRNDGVKSNSVVVVPTLHHRVFSVFYFSRKKISFRQILKSSDLVILEFVIGNSDPYIIIPLSKFLKTKIAFWGQGKTFRRPEFNFEERLKKWMLKNTDFYFAYAEHGKQFLIKERNYPGKKIQVLNNSTDTKLLKKEIFETTDDATKVVLDKYGIKGDFILYLGAFSVDKKIDFLVEAAEIAYKANPNFTLVLCGTGTEKQRIDEQITDKLWIKSIGSTFGKEKAVLLKNAKFITTPYAVGLITTDSFAAETPILAVDALYNTVEFTYLKSGYNSLIVEENLNSYAEGINKLLTDQSFLTTLMKGCQEDSNYYSTENMVDNFYNGICRALK